MSFCNGYFRDDGCYGYGLSFGYGPGFGSYHEGFRKECCVPWFPGAGYANYYYGNCCYGLRSPWW